MSRCAAEERRENPRECKRLNASAQFRQMMRCLHYPAEVVESVERRVRARMGGRIGEELLLDLPAELWLEKRECLSLPQGEHIFHKAWDHARALRRRAVPPLRLKGRHLDCPEDPEREQTFQWLRIGIQCRFCKKKAFALALPALGVHRVEDRGFLVTAVRGGEGERLFDAPSPETPRHVPEMHHRNRSERVSEAAELNEFIGAIDAMGGRLPSSCQAVWTHAREYVRLGMKPEWESVAASAGLPVSAVQQAWRRLRGEIRTLLFDGIDAFQHSLASSASPRA